jgi:two-component SAPR family response regulator
MNMSTMPQALTGKRVLIVEDEALVALMLQDSLAEIGCIPVGPCNSVSKAMDKLKAESFDLALLDVNLNGEKVYPVAYALEERHVPFLFVTGYGESAIPPDRRNWKICMKPFRLEDLTAMIQGLLQTATAVDRCQAKGGDATS